MEDTANCGQPQTSEYRVVLLGVVMEDTANCGQPQTSEYRVVLLGVVMEDSKLWPAPDKWVPSCFVRRGDGRQQTVASPRQVSTELFCLAWWWKTANCGQPQTSEYRVVLLGVVMEDSKLWPAPDKWVPSCFVWRGDGRQQTVASPRQVSTELFCLAWWWKTQQTVASPRQVSTELFC